MVRTKKAASRKAHRGVENPAIERLEFGLPQMASTPMPHPSMSGINTRRRSSHVQNVRGDASSADESPERSTRAPRSAAATQRSSNAPGSAAPLQRSSNAPGSAAALQRSSNAQTSAAASRSAHAASISGQRNTSALSTERSSRTATRPGPSRTTPRRRRMRPGVKALLEIRKYQKSTCLLLRRLPFSRVVRDISRQILSTHQMEDLRWQAVALSCLQEAAEAFLVHLFENAQHCAIHGHRKTVMLRDLWLLRNLKMI